MSTPDSAEGGQTQGENKDGMEEVDEEAVKQREEEMHQAQAMKEEALAKVKEKQAFKQKNVDAAGHRPDLSSLKKLDGSVKKNSAFVKKLRTLTEQQKASLTSDFESLNLSKYIQEAATNITEAKLKVADVGCAVHLCSLLHRRYAEFSPLLMDQLQKIYSIKIKNDDDRSTSVTKYRLGLRLLGELVLCGVVEEDVGLSLLRDMLSMVIEADRRAEGRPYLSVVLSFARNCAEDIAGILPRKQRLILSKYSIEPPSAQLVPPASQEEFCKMLHEYFASVSEHLQRQHHEMHQREERNIQMLQNKGELTEKRKKENEDAQKTYDKLLTNANTLADILDRDMPDLPVFQPPQQASSDVSIELQIPAGLAEMAELDPSSLWEDEESRQFYEFVTDIKPFVPAILFEGKKRGTSESSDTPSPAEGEGATPANKEEEEDEAKVLEQVIRDTEQISLKEEEEEPKGEGEPEEVVEEKGSGQGVEPGSAAALLEEFIGRLPSLMNRKFVDEFAAEFCLQMNFKGNRHRLAKALFNVDKNRMDLIPFYARLAATLAPCLEDFAPMLVDLLIRDFRFQVKKKDQVHIHSKIKNCRFIAELTKFGLCPKAETMRCITLCLHDFTHHSIDMACTFIEHCGRYLLRSSDSHLRAKALLEIMVRKKHVQRTLDGRQRSMIENALYAANPPEASRAAVVVHPPMLEYIWRLLYKDLNKSNTEKVLRQMRKLDWNDPEVFHYAVTSLSQVWRLKFSNIHCLANLLAGLKPYQEDAAIRVVDAVLEDVRLGLEINVPKFNQRRVSCVKFLGELYNYQLVESIVIFRVLYLLISFGWNMDGSPSPLDPYDNYFRVRLVCTLLDACGQYFDRGTSKRKMDVFLVFFQCYLFRKRQPFPMEVEHLVLDTLESLRPDLVPCSTFQEAYEAAAELEKKYKDKIGDWQHMEDEEEEEEEEEDLRGSRLEDEEEEEEGEEEEEEGGEEDDENEEDEEQPNLQEEPEPVLKLGPKYIHTQEDDDFIAALDKMMSEDLQQRRQENVKVPLVDIGVPMAVMGGGAKSKPEEPLLYDEGEVKMKFRFVTRGKGHKQQLKELNVPIDSDLASGLKDTQQARKDEHHEMKKLVLAYEKRQEEEDYSAMVAAEQLRIRQTRKQQLFEESSPQSPRRLPQQPPPQPQQQQQYTKQAGKPRQPGQGKQQQQQYRQQYNTQQQRQQQVQQKQQQQPRQQQPQPQTQQQPWQQTQQQSQQQTQQPRQQTQQQQQQQQQRQQQHPSSGRGGASRHRQQRPPPKQQQMFDDQLEAYRW